MYPILMRVPNAFVYSYTAVWGVAILLVGVLLARRGVRLQTMLTLLLVVGTAALLGGRFAFVLGNQSYFAEHPAEITQLWRGGLGYLGAMAGGGLAFVLFGWRHPRPLAHWLYLVAPALAFLYSMGWFACWLDGCAYGQQTVLSWYTAEMPDSYGVYGVRYPIQQIGMLAALCLFGWSDWVGGYGRFWWTLALLATLHTLLSLGRADEMVMVGNGWRLDTVVMAGTAVVSLIIGSNSPQIHLSPPKK